MTTGKTKSVAEALAQKFAMIWESKRFATFTSWPFENDKPCSALKLAEAGFYFAGSKEEPDSVQCFFCDKALDGWDEGDDPWAEHLSHSANCAFAQLGQPEEALTFEQLSNFYIQLIKKHIEKGIEDLHADNDKIYNLRLAKLKKTVNLFKRN